MVIFNKLIQVLTKKTFKTLNLKILIKNKFLNKNNNKMNITSNLNKMEKIFNTVLILIIIKIVILKTKLTKHQKKIYNNQVNLLMKIVIKTVV